MAGDRTDELRDLVRMAHASRTPLRIQGGGTKGFYGRPCAGEIISLAGHTGITNYEPTELVITARAGTTLREIEQALAEQGQMLPFEPPHFGAGATLGGTIACNLSGPRRPHAGAARDLVLGTRILNGKGEALRFGGEVMKNVAGYDVSRLMAGAMGTLGVLLELSLKVLPRPELETTLVRAAGVEEALALFHEFAREPLPISATSYRDGLLHLRLSGTADAVNQARGRIGGDSIPDGETFWRDLKEQRRSFFAGPERLWRLSVASNAKPIELASDLAGDWLYEWGGALRWLKGDLPAEQVRAAAEAVGGHATLFRGEGEAAVFHPLPEPLLRLHRNLKQAFDPHGILNPGRLYAGL